MRPAAPAGPLATASLLTPSATSAEIARPSVILLYTPSMKARRPWSTWTSERVAAAWGLARELLASIGFLARFTMLSPVALSRAAPRHAVFRAHGTPDRHVVPGVETV